jgi:hypothetical protein
MAFLISRLARGSAFGVRPHLSAFVSAGPRVAAMAKTGMRGFHGAQADACGYHGQPIAVRASAYLADATGVYVYKPAQVRGPSAPRDHARARAPHKAVHAYPRTARSPPAPPLSRGCTGRWRRA